ncbi:MAG: ABC1 kinase family protein [bacterium]
MRLIRRSFGERLREALVELGPTFIKFGQILSDRKDILPPAVIREMEKLQDKVPPFPTATARRLVEANLGRSLEDAFIFFNEEPEAAASLAQVHRAILPTGETVAVKIKRPGIDAQIEADIQIMHQLASFVDHNTDYFRVIKAKEIVEEFERQMLRELDFVEESLAVKKFRADYEGDKTVYVPRVYSNYTTRDMLVLEFIHGQKVSAVIEGESERFDKSVVNLRTADFIMSQLFINGYFHADPHPGNFMVLEGNIICFLDFGMVYSLRPYEVENLNYMMLGLARLDAMLVSRSLLRLGGAEGKVNKQRFQAHVHDYIESHLNRPLEYIDVAGALMDLLQMIISFGVKLPPRLIYVAKVMGSLQSIGSGLDPEFQLLEYLRNFSPKIWANQLASGRTGNRVLLSGLNWSEVLLDAPELVRDLQRVLQDREFEVHAPELDAVRETYDKVGFRMVFGLVLSALLISSSLVVLADIEPKISGIPVFGIIGFGIGLAMGLGFLFAGVIKLFRWRHRQ